MTEEVVAGPDREHAPKALYRDWRVRHPVPASENGGEYLSGLGE